MGEYIMQESALERAIVVGNTTIRDYLYLSKPGIVILALIATLTGIYFARQGFPSVSLLSCAILGMGLASAGSCILNNYIDRDIDSIMGRTSSRALAVGRFSPIPALITGLLMVVSSIVIFAVFVNELAALLTVASVMMYVFLYSMFLKRRTHFANYIGGIAGAMPPVVGYASVVGRVGMVPIILFIIVLVWQQTHAMSLALRYKDDYARAGIPVLPVVKGCKITRLSIVCFSVVLLILSAMPYLYGMAGLIYLLSAISLGTMYLVLAVIEVFSIKKNDMRLFFFSILYLTFLFTVMIMDVVR